MLTGLIILLIVFALITVIWGRKVAQNLFGCIVIIALWIITGAWYLLTRPEHTNTKDQQNINNTNTVINPNAGQVRKLSQFPTTSVGIQYSELSSVMSDLNNLPRGVGEFVENVIPDSQAAKAGIQVGDYLIGADGYYITSTNTLSSVEARHRQGDMVTFVFIHAAHKYNVTIKIGVPTQ